MRIALIGNFVVPYTTESYLANAFRDLGCSVHTISQDEAYERGPDAVMNAVADGGAALCTYTRTHNRTALVGERWTEAWRKLETRAVATASIHLDRYWDLRGLVPSGDDMVPREELVERGDPLFTTQHVFTADGGNDARWAAAGVNHHWLPPAVDKDEACWPARPQRSYDVVFVGSGSQYHVEYPQRIELVQHLLATYGSRFAHYGHGGGIKVVRQQDLNDVYASAKVVVGDSCFANSPDPALSALYWSDRIPETIGRGGFLLHPFVVGVRHSYAPDELACYNPGDWEDLDARIGEFLANPGEREGYVERGRERVLRDHTYTVRMQTVLETVGLPVPVPAT